MQAIINNQGDAMRILDTVRKEMDRTNEEVFISVAAENTYYRWKRGATNICVNDLCKLCEVLGLRLVIESK